MRNRKAEVLLAAFDMAPDGLSVELGCIRQEHEVPEDGYSTVHLARSAAERGREFRSFDNEQPTVDLANRVLQREGLDPLVECRDGATAVTELGPISFLYLDSHRDPEISLAQYRAAELAPGAIVAIDDTHRYEGWEYGKATDLIALCMERPEELPFDLVETFSNGRYTTYMTVIQVVEGKTRGEL